MRDAIAAQVKALDKREAELSLRERKLEMREQSLERKAAAIREFVKGVLPDND